MRRLLIASAAGPELSAAAVAAWAQAGVELVDGGELFADDDDTG